MHLDDDRIQRLIDGELPAGDGAAARAHLHGCAACRDRLREAEDDVGGIHSLLATLDGPPTPVTVDRVVDAASRARGRGPRVGGPRLRWAAGIAIGLGAAGAAYALPGSHLRAWLASRVESRGVPAGEQAAIAETAPGISILPGANLVVEVTGTGGSPDVTVALTEGPELTVQARGGSASFRSDAARLRAVADDPDVTFEIEIPRQAARVELVRDGSTIFLKRGDAVRTAPAPDEEGRYVLRADG